MEFFGKNETLGMIHWFGFALALLGLFLVLAGLFFMAQGDPSWFFVLGGGVVCLAQLPLFAGLEFLVRAAIRYLELHKNG